MENTRKNWRNAKLIDSSTVQDAIENLNEVAIQIVLVIDDAGTLLGTVSDGDIRRALLRGESLSNPVTKVMQGNPLVVPENLDRETILKMMRANKIHQIPIVDDERKVVGLHLWDELTAPIVRENIMVIMAGGFGSRLRPNTNSCPKPMLEVAGKPMLEHIIARAVQDGFRNIYITVHYLGHIIEDYFGDGSGFDISITYLKENEPLGTAGGLSILSPSPDLPFVVSNGDVITDIKYDELLHFHNKHEAMATMAVRMHEMQHPFGVVHMDGVEIIGFEEKPVMSSHVNAGIYVLSPSVLEFVEKDRYLTMPNLFSILQDQNLKTVAYPMHEPWLDLGRPEDLEQASKALFINKKGV